MQIKDPVVFILNSYCKIIKTSEAIPNTQVKHLLIRIIMDCKVVIKYVQ